MKQKIMEMNNEDKLALIKSNKPDKLLASWYKENKDNIYKQLICL